MVAVEEVYKARGLGARLPPHHHHLHAAQEEVAGVAVRPRHTHAQIDKEKSRVVDPH